LNGERVGLLSFDARQADVEVVYLEVTVRHSGVGTRLIEALMDRSPARRVWLVTTNDNLEALRFYQRRGFRVTEIRPGAVDEARRTLKPAIPEAGNFGIPIRDEIVLERRTRP
jgi:ribosomal protein S18 acetylase RimI-like enzyme